MKVVIKKKKTPSDGPLYQVWHMHTGTTTTLVKPELLLQVLDSACLASETAMELRCRDTEGEKIPPCQTITKLSQTRWEETANGSLIHGLFSEGTNVASHQRSSSLALPDAVRNKRSGHSASFLV